MRSQQEFDLSKANEESGQLLEKESERPDQQEAKKALDAENQKVKPDLKQELYPTKFSF